MDEEQQLEQYGQPEAVPQFPQSGATAPRAVPVPGSLYGTESFEDIYGYRPETPQTAYTSSGQLTPHGRRAMRAQQEYDYAYKTYQNQQQAAAQAYANQMQEQRAQRDQYIQEATFAKDMALKDQEQTIKAQMAAEVAEAANILKSINPQDPNAGVMYSSLATQFPLAMRDEGFNRAMSITSGVHNDYMQSAKIAQERAMAYDKDQALIKKDLYAAGYTDKDMPKFYKKDLPVGRVEIDPNLALPAIGMKESEEKAAKTSPDKSSALQRYYQSKGRYEELKRSDTSLGGEELQKARVEYRGAQRGLMAFQGDKDISNALTQVLKRGDEVGLETGDVFVDANGKMRVWEKPSAKP